MRFDFANHPPTGGWPMLELKGTDQLKKGSSWPHSSGVETMSRMPGETRAVINWSSQFIDKSRVCLARHRHSALTRRFVLVLESGRVDRWIVGVCDVASKMWADIEIV
jgi:hypothetical protein